jgi:ABC-type multidrug transport system permease subunit
MLSDAVRLLLLIAAMTAVGLAVGFRVHTGPLAALAGLGLTLAFGMAFSWVMIYLALALRTAEATQAAGQTLMFLLTFLSSAFVPLATMPGWLQAIARLNPVIYAVDALRALLVGGPMAGRCCWPWPGPRAWSSSSPRSRSAATSADKTRSAVRPKRLPWKAQTGTEKAWPVPS